MAENSMAESKTRRTTQGQTKVSVRFRVPYYTKWGESVMVSGSDPTLGSWNIKNGLKMYPRHEGSELVWYGQLIVPAKIDARYNYCLVDEKQNIIKWESGNRRCLELPSGLPIGATVDIYDLWQDGCAPESLLTKSAFRKVIFKSEDMEELCEDTHAGENHIISELVSNHDNVYVCFKLNCTTFQKGQRVYIRGSAPSLGEWDSEKAFQLSYSGDGHWYGQCLIDKSEFPVGYHYILKDKAGDVIPELGEDRELILDSHIKRPASVLIVTDGYFRGTPWRGAGLAIPVFSLRSQDDVGVGEFLDLKLLVDLSVKSGLSLVQLLPINDTSVYGMWWDSYPYSSVSVCALHPLYLRLQNLSKNIPRDIKNEIELARKRLDYKEVDYDNTMAVKLRIAKKIFNLERETVFSSPEFQQFFEDNEGWLRPYAAFCFLRDLFGTSDHSKWGLYAHFSQAKLEKLVSPSSDHYAAIAFVYYIQFHLHLQLSDAAEYARSHRVVLKGDLPIGVGRDSVETWVFPTLFRMNTSTGAPPDYFDKNGQNWGFPTYNWEEMSKDNYAWWRARLTQMAKYFDAYRIDHILGFFRIWELPDHAVTGLMGHFRPSIPLSKAELEREGIWDFNLLSEPYVRSHMLKEKFGNKASEISKRFFEEYQDGCYKFKEQYNTEKKIIAELQPRDGSPSWVVEDALKTQAALFDLLHEVVLMRDEENAEKFYPRFNIMDTSLYKEMDEHSKDVLLKLYYDYFYHRQDNLWRENALKTLPVLMNSSDMLACGEDLGLIPECVPPVLKELGLLGLRIQRMPNKSGEDFNDPAEYDYMTVCAPSCHDCSTLRAWWEEDKTLTEKFYRTILGQTVSPPSKCEANIVHSILRQHMESPSMWAIFPLQDILAIEDKYATRPPKEETINDPTNPKHYWRYRVHICMETLLQDSALVAKMKDLVDNGGRTPLHMLSHASSTPHYSNGIEDDILRSSKMEQLELLSIA